MGNFFKKHPDSVLTAIVVVFLAIIGVYLSWGFTELTTQIGQVVTVNSAPPANASYDLDGAAKLNFRGLTQ